jgi:hypothetical protein
MLEFWETWKRAATGPECREKDFDMMIYKRARELKVEHGIRFDRQSPVPIDSSMAKDVYQAGLTLFLELGTLYTTGGHLVRVTDEEVKSALNEMPESIKVGSEKDEVWIRKGAGKRGGGHLLQEGHANARSQKGYTLKRC